MRYEGKEQKELKELDYDGIDYKLDCGNGKRFFVGARCRYGIDYQSFTMRWAEIVRNNNHALSDNTGCDITIQAHFISRDDLTLLSVGLCKTKELIRYFNNNSKDI